MILNGCIIGYFVTMMIRHIIHSIGLDLKIMTNIVLLFDVVLTRFSNVEDQDSVNNLHLCVFDDDPEWLHYWVLPFDKDIIAPMYEFKRNEIVYNFGLNYDFGSP
jgi:hypothetical protein